MHGWVIYSAGNLACQKTPQSLLTGSASCPFYLGPRFTEPDPGFGAIFGLEVSVGGASMLLPMYNERLPLILKELAHEPAPNRGLPRYF